MEFYKQLKNSWLHSVHVLFPTVSNWRLSLILMEPRIYVSNLKGLFSDLFQIFSDHFFFSQLSTRCTQRKLFTVQFASVLASQSNRNDWKCVCIKISKMSIKSMKPKRNFVFLLFTQRTSTAVDTYAFLNNIQYLNV